MIPKKIPIFLLLQQKDVRVEESEKGEINRVDDLYRSIETPHLFWYTSILFRVMTHIRLDK